MTRRPSLEQFQGMLPRELVASLEEVVTNPSASGGAVSIQQVVPTCGAAGDSIAVFGSGFSGLAPGQVTVGNVVALFNVNNDSRLTFTVPALAGSGAVQVGNAVTAAIFNVYDPSKLSLDLRSTTLDPRLAVSAAGVVSIRTNTELAQLIQPSGLPWNFPQSIDWTVRYIWDPLAADGYLFCATIDGEEWSMRTTSNGTNIQLMARGVDDIATGSIFGSGSLGVTPGDEVTVRWIYNSETSATNQLLVKINGVESTPDGRDPPIGPTISATSAAYVGSNNGTSPYGGKITFFGAAGDVDLLPNPEFVMIGDSTMAGNGVVFTPSSSDVYTVIERWTRDGIFSLATSGHTIELQTIYWDDRPAWMTDTNVKVAVVQLGINNIILQADSAATVITKLQGFVDHIKATGPAGMKIVLMKLLPTGLVNQGTWATINEAIMGGGSTPITGVDVRVGDASDALYDGAGNIKEALSMGDNLHPNTGGRQIVSRYIRDALVTLGLLP